MVIRLRITCVGGADLNEPCVRVVAMEDTASLIDLHEMIQDAVSFDRDHVFGFCIANSASPWAQKTWLSVSELWEAQREDYGDIEIRDALPTGRKKLFYLFDPGDRWIFKIQKLRSSKADALIAAPQILERIGPDPEQYPGSNDPDDWDESEESEDSEE